MLFFSTVDDSKYIFFIIFLYYYYCFDFSFKQVSLIRSLMTANVHVSHLRDVDRDQCLVCHLPGGFTLVLSSYSTAQSSITSHAFVIIQPTTCPWATPDEREGKNKREINVTRPKNISLESPYSALIMFCIRYKIKLNSDELQYGGHGRLVLDTEFFTEPMPLNGRAQSFLVSLISITTFHS